MINTINIKQAQLTKGYFQVGSGPEKILIMGSCRVCPYVEYFHQWNLHNGNRFTIYTLDPFNNHWDIKDNRVDYDLALKTLETHTGLLTMIKSVDVFIHEFYKNAGMFNCDKGSDTGIYAFGMSPKIDICIPSFNDLFILYGDIVSFDLEIRKKALQDHKVTGKLSQETEQQMFDISLRNVLKFYGVCEKSDIPEMKQYFADNFKHKRLFWNSNHVSKHFTLAIFAFINNTYLHLPITDEFENSIQHDLFANNFTYLTPYDIVRYGYEWDEEIKPLL